MKGFIVGVWALLACGLAMSAACLWFVSYADFLAWAVSFLHIADKRAQFAGLLTSARFEQARFALSVLGILGLASLRLAYPTAERISRFAGEFWRMARLAYVFCRRDAYFWAILTLGSLPILWRLCAHDFWVDEIFSYLFLVRKGVLVSLSYYPGPNNHVFFNVVCAFFGSLWAMRAAAFLGVLLTAWLLYVWQARLFGRQTARWVLLLFMLQSPVQLYGYLGRGYAWEMLFCLVCWASLMEWRATGKTFFLTLSSLSAILGFYTLPTFLYPYSSLCCVVMFSRGARPFLKIFFLHQIAVILAVLFLYAPIILLNGWGALAGNAWLSVGKAHFWRDFLTGTYGAEVVGFWGLDAPIYVFWAMCFFIGFLLYRAPAVLRGWLVPLFVLPIGWLAYQQILPPVRVWSYQAVAVAVLLGNVSIGRIGAIFFAGVLGWYWQFLPASPAHDWARRIVNSRPTTAFSQDDTYQMFVRYEATIRKQSLDIQVVCPDKQASFDIYILAKGQPLPACFSPTHCQKVGETEEVEIWRRGKP